MVYVKFLKVCMPRQHSSVAEVMAIYPIIKVALIYLPVSVHNTFEDCRVISVTTHASKRSYNASLDWTSYQHKQIVSGFYLHLGNTSSKTSRHLLAEFIRLSPIYCGSGIGEYLSRTSSLEQTNSYLTLVHTPSPGLRARRDLGYCAKNHPQLSFQDSPPCV